MCGTEARGKAKVKVSQVRCGWTDVERAGPGLLSRSDRSGTEAREGFEVIMAVRKRVRGASEREKRVRE